MPRSKKGRISGTVRKEINERRAADAIHGRADGVAFARVTKMTGANHVRVAIASKHGQKELSARIPNIFARRGATPITTRDVVTVYVGRDFDPDNYVPKASEHFDIAAVLTVRQAHELRKSGAIPDWMVVEGEETASKHEGGGGFEFDYSGIKEGDESESDSDAEPVPAVAASFSRKVARDAVDAEVDIDDI